jgi:hypothetical protein
MWDQQDQVGAAGSGGSSRIMWDQQDQVGAAGSGWSRVRREEQHDQGRGTQVQSTTLMKKKRKFSSCIRKFRMDRVQSHI